MAKKKSSKIESAIQATIKNEVEKLYGDDEDLTIIPPTTTELDKFDPVVNKILAAFPSSEGYYGKVYRKSSNGRLDFKHYLDALEDIDDPELEIYNIVKDKGWEDGDYILRVFKRGLSSSEAQKTISFKISIQDRETIRTTPSKEESLNDKISEIGSLIKTVKEITGTSPQKQESSTDILRTLKSYNEIVKDIKEENSLQTPTEPIVQPNSMQTMLDTIRIMKEIESMSKPQKSPDILTEIERLSHLGIIKLPGSESNEKEKEDPIDQIVKIKDLIAVVAPLANPGSDKTSVGVELIKALVPQIGEIIKDISVAVKSVTEANRAKIGYKPIPLNTGVDKNKIKPVEESIKETMNMQHPVMKSITEAIINKDNAFFSKLEEIIILYAGSHVVENLVSGNVSVDLFLQNIQQVNPVFSTPQAKEYIENFIKWVRNSQIVSVCNKCKEEFLFKDEKEYISDSKQCECGGLLEVPKVNGQQQEQTATQFEGKV